MSNATHYTFNDAVTEAETYVRENPIASGTPQARVAYHAILRHFRELGISSEDRKRIIELWVEAEGSLWEDGWSKGWDSGYDSGKQHGAPPF